MDKRYLHKGILITQTPFRRFRVHAYGWGDRPGEDGHTFRSLTLAKAFIDRMQAECAQPAGQ